MRTPELHVIFIFISEIQVNAARKLGCCLTDKADKTVLRHYSLVNFKKFSMITVLFIYLFIYYYFMASMPRVCKQLVLAA